MSHYDASFVCTKQFVYVISPTFRDTARVLSYVGMAFWLLMFSVRAAVVTVAVLKANVCYMLNI
jgi:hypothetical protein